MRENLSLIPRAINISKHTMNIIKSNLFWAFFYNILVIPIAAVILYPFRILPDYLRMINPMPAAFAMAFSSISVVLNSLRLRNIPLE